MVVNSTLVTTSGTAVFGTEKAILQGFRSAAATSGENMCMNLLAKNSTIYLERYKSHRRVGGRICQLLKLQFIDFGIDSFC